MRKFKTQYSRVKNFEEQINSQNKTNYKKNEEKVFKQFF